MESVKCFVYVMMDLNALNYFTTQTQTLTLTLKTRSFYYVPMHKTLELEEGGRLILMTIFIFSVYFWPMPDL